MSKETLEQLSSLMDGELSRETGLFLTRRLSADEELTGTWERYHLIRDCIRYRDRRQGGHIRVTDFSQRVRVALSEEVVTARQVLPSRRWLKPVTGMAIAASVAVMAIFAVGSPQPGLNPVPVPGLAVERFTSPNNLMASPITQPASFSPQAPKPNQRLNSYLLRHNQLAGSAGMQGFVSFVPIISAGNTQTPVTEDPEAITEKVREPTQP